MFRIGSAKLVCRLEPEATSLIDWQSLLLRRQNFASAIVPAGSSVSCWKEDERVHMVDWVSSDRFLSDAPSHAAVVAAVPAGSSVSSSKEIVWTDLHSENDTGRNLRAPLQRCCDLSSCTLADLPPFERPVGVGATSGVFICFYDGPCFSVLNQRPSRFFSANSKLKSLKSCNFHQPNSSSFWSFDALNETCVLFP